MSTNITGSSWPPFSVSLGDFKSTQKDDWSCQGVTQRKLRMLEPEFSLMIFRRKKVALANHGLPNHVCPSLPSWFPSGYVFALKCFLTSYCTVPPGGQNLYRVRPASHCAHGVKLLTLQVYHGLSSFNARHGHFSGSFVKPLLFAAPKVSTSFLSICFFRQTAFLDLGIIYIRAGMAGLVESLVGYLSLRACKVFKLTCAVI